eukprot:TRINITY_DN1721_c0_g2_i2.p1 TRINITY_DN1721_c0_g2~~TRINITY_DN1721_c0_g2_i2.p1  ORF type:complete len:2544 (-),score=357.02 TRINITY_DN1721_c0_g2_i2:210-7004(-)
MWGDLVDHAFNMPIASISESRPVNITLYGSTANITAIIDCPIITKEDDSSVLSIPYCQTNGLNPSFEDHLHCDQGLQLISAQSDIFLKAVCVVFGMATDWMNDDIFATKHISMITQPTPIQHEIIGGIQFKFNCAIGTAVSYSNNSTTTLDTWTDLYVTSNFTVACLSDDGVLGPFITYTFHVPIASTDETKPIVVLEGMANDYRATIQCSDDSIAYCLLGGLLPSFNDRYACNQTMTMQPTVTYNAVLKSICVIMGHAVDWSNDAMYDTKDIAYIYEPIVFQQDVLGGVSVAFNCSAGDVVASTLRNSSLHIIEMPAVQPLYETTVFNVSCIHQGLYGPTRQYTIEVPEAPESLIKPTIHLIGSSNNVNATIECPVQVPSASAVVYCSNGDYPQPSDEYICDHSVDVSPVSANLNTTITAICVAFGAASNWEDINMFAIEEVQFIKKPRPTSADIIGGIECGFVCEVGEALEVGGAMNEGNEMAVVNSLTSVNLYNTTEFTIACVNQDLLGPPLKHVFEVPAATKKMASVKFGMSGMGNNITIVLECEYDDDFIPYCAVDKYPRFTEEFICLKPQQLELVNATHTIYSACLASGYSFNWADPNMFSSQELHALQEPTLVTSNIIGGYNVTFDCPLGVPICTDDLTDRLHASDWSCDNTNKVFGFGTFKAACVYQGLMGPILKANVTVPNAKASQTKPKMVLSGMANYVWAKFECPKVKASDGKTMLESIPYCSRATRPGFFDGYKCLEGCNSSPETEFAHKTIVYAICVIDGLRTDFKNPKLFTTETIQEIYDPVLTTTDIHGGFNVSVSCKVGKPICSTNKAAPPKLTDYCKPYYLIYDSLYLESGCSNQNIHGMVEMWDITVPFANATSITPLEISRMPIFGGFAVDSIKCPLPNSIPLLKLDEVPQWDDVILNYPVEVIDLKPFDITSFTTRKLIQVHIACKPLGQKFPEVNKWSRTVPVIYAPSPTFDVSNKLGGFEVKVQCDAEHVSYMSQRNDDGSTDAFEATDKRFFFQNHKEAIGWQAYCVGPDAGASVYTELLILGNPPTAITALSAWLFPDQLTGDYVTSIKCEDDQSIQNLEIIDHHSDMFDLLRHQDPSEEEWFDLYLLANATQFPSTFEIMFKCTDEVNMIKKSTITFNVHQPPAFDFRSLEVDHGVVVSISPAELLISGFDEFLPKYSSLLKLGIYDFELATTFSCKIRNSDLDASPFVVEVHHSDAMEIATNTANATVNVVLKYPTLLNAALKPNIGFTLQCNDQFRLVTPPVYVNVLLQDSIPPQVQWIKRPPTATLTKSAEFEFQITDGNIPCPECDFTCVMNGIAQDCLYNSTVNTVSWISENGDNLDITNSFQVNVTDLKGNHALYEVVWKIVEVSVLPYIRYNVNKEPRIFKIGIDKLEINESGQFKDNGMSVAGAWVDVGLELSTPLNINEVVTATCSLSNNEVAQLDVHELHLSDRDAVTWMRVTSLNDTRNTADKIPFSINCSITSSDSNHYGLCPSFSLDGIRTSVIWPIFDDILHHQTTLPSSFDRVNTAKFISSLSDDGVFSFTAVGGEYITIVPHQKFIENDEPVFLSDVVVMLDDIKLPQVCSNEVLPCEITVEGFNMTLKHVPDGITVQLPEYSEVCLSNYNEDVCKDSPYRKLTIRNPHAIGTQSPFNGAIGGSLSCGQYCANGQKGQGIFYSRKCEGFVNSRQCSSDQAFSQAYCAVVINNKCHFCSDISQNAICPGGNRLWPSTGFWLSSETNGVPQKCSFPAEERCKGWDENNNVPLCGKLYTGPMCKSCVEGYYSEFNICQKCPDEGNIRWKTPLICGAAVAVVLICLLWHSSHVNDGSFIGGASRILSVLIWFAVTLQVLIQVGQSSAGYMPASVQGFFSVINVFQLGFIHPSCNSDDPVMFEKFVFGTCAILHAIMIIIGVILMEKSQPLALPLAEVSKQENGLFLKCLIMIQKVLILVGALMYPLVLNSAVKWMDCKNVEGTYVLRSNSRITCYEHDTLLMNVIAWFLFAIVVVATPLFTFIRLRDQMKMIVHKQSAAVVDASLDRSEYVANTVWSYFLNDDIRGTLYYYRHIGQLILVLMTLMMSFGVASWVTTMTNMSLLILLAIIYFKYKPFIDSEKWRNNVTILILLSAAAFTGFNGYACLHWSTTMLDLFGIGLLILTTVLFFICVAYMVMAIYSGAQLEGLAISRTAENNSSHTFNPLFTQPQCLYGSKHPQRGNKNRSKGKRKLSPLSPSSKQKQKLSLDKHSYMLPSMQPRHQNSHNP